MVYKELAALPEVVRVEPSSACNLSCIHCPTSFSDQHRGIMKRGTFDLILKRLESVKPRVVVLYHGGEPFLNKNIFYMIGMLKESFHPFVKIVTNGMRIEEWMFEKIVLSKLDGIEFSLDGNSAEENDSIRVGCSAEKVLSNIDRLIHWKREMSSATPLITIANCVIIDKNDSTTYLTGRQSNVPKYLSEYMTKHYSDEIFFKGCYAIPWPGWKSDGFSIFHSTERVVSMCEQLWEVMTIRYNGDVVSCCYDIMSNRIMGNIFNSSIEEVWNNDLFIAMRRSIMDRNPLPMCENCDRVRPGTFIVKKGN
jgi:radical SAM protein with 4Fe4S-binding SPASM domain